MGPSSCHAKSVLSTPFDRTSSLEAHAHTTVESSRHQPSTAGVLKHDSWLCRYNQVAPEPVACTGSKTLAVLVGNNKNLWRMFLEACQREPSLLRAEDPLDAYVEGEVQAAALATGWVARTERDSATCVWCLS